MSESMKNALSEVDSVKQSVANSTPPAVSNRSRKRSAAHWIHADAICCLHERGGQCCKHPRKHQKLRWWSDHDRQEMHMSQTIYNISKCLAVSLICSWFYRGLLLPASTQEDTHTHIQTLELLSQAGKNLVGAVEGANLSARTGDSQIIVFKCFYDLSLEAVPLDPLGFSTVGPFNFWFQLLEVVTLRPVSILARRNAILAFETCSLRAMVGHGRPFSPFFFCVLPGLICSEIGILPLLLWDFTDWLESPRSRIFSPVVCQPLPHFASTFSRMFTHKPVFLMKWPPNIP